MAFRIKIRLLIVIGSTFLLMSCMQDDADKIELPIIPIDDVNINIIDAEKPVKFTANLDVVKLTAEVKVDDELDSRFLIGSWSNHDGNVLKYDSLNESGLYTFELNNLSNTFHTIYFKVSNHRGEAVSDSIILNNRPYVNLKNLAVGQKSTFTHFNNCNYTNSKDSVIHLAVVEFDSINYNYVLKEYSNGHSADIILSQFGDLIYIDIPDFYDWENKGSVLFYHFILTWKEFEYEFNLNPSTRKDVLGHCLDQENFPGVSGSLRASQVTINEVDYEDALVQYFDTNKTFSEIYIICDNRVELTAINSSFHELGIHWDYWFKK